MNKKPVAQRLTRARRKAVRDAVSAILANRAIDVPAEPSTATLIGAQRMTYAELDALKKQKGHK